MIDIDQVSGVESASGIDDEEDSDEYLLEVLIQSFLQSELNDLVRDLGLPKDGSEYLASFLKGKNLLEPTTIVSFHRNGDTKFRQYFCKDENSSLVFCIDVEGLINELKPNRYDAKDSRLFMDSSKRSIKAVLLHNTNVYAPVAIAHSTIMQEKYENIGVLLKKIDYETHQRQV